MKYLMTAVFLYWFFKGTDLIIGILFRIPHLKKRAACDLPTGFAPKVSIVFAARNEALHIKEAVQMMLAQDYANFEVIAVDDRSEDSTGAILDSFNDERFKVVSVTSLPQGWLGKNHALYQGYLASSGRWILFTDADVKFSPQLLKDAVCVAEKRKLDHLSLFPRIILKNYIEVVFVSYFSLIFNMRFRPWAAKSQRSNAFVGIGAFNFVRREAYEKIGTHRALALDVADDMILGKRIKMTGFHQMGMYGDSAVSVRWVDGVRGVFNSLHKNAFRGLNFNFYHLVIATLGIILVDVLPFMGLWLFHGAAFWLCASAVVFIGLCYLAGSSYTGATILAFPAHGVASLSFIIILWRSALSGYFQGGVRWRGTLYPLKDLREASEQL